MKRRRVIFILSIISLIVLSLNICSFAMNTGFSTSEPDEKKQQYFLSGNAISLTYEEPKKYIISCFDVSESGLVAVGSATYGNQYIYVYDATGKFQYGYAFNNPGSYGLQWDGSDLIIYFVRSDIAALVDSAGNIKELKVIDDTEANNSYWDKYVFAKERTQNGNTYTMKSNMGLLNIVATGYSQIIITAPDGQETMIYDVSKAQKSGTVLEITFAMLFVGAVVYGLTREFSKAKKRAK